MAKFVEELRRAMGRSEICGEAKQPIAAFGVGPEGAVEAVRGVGAQGLVVFHYGAFDLEMLREVG